MFLSFVCSSKPSIVCFMHTKKAIVIKMLIDLIGQHWHSSSCNIFFWELFEEVENPWTFSHLIWILALSELHVLKCGSHVPCSSLHPRQPFGPYSSPVQTSHARHWEAKITVLTFVPIFRTIWPCSDFFLLDFTFFLPLLCVAVAYHYLPPCSMAVGTWSMCLQCHGACWRG